MSENMENAQKAIKLVSKMISYIELYEAGTYQGPGDFVFTLSAQNIADLKTAFASARTECITALNAISAS